MKKIFPAVLVLCSAMLPLNAAEPTPTVNLTTKDPNQELASGFAAAFNTIRNVPIHLMMDRDGKTTILSDLRKITAVGSVLVVENGKAQIYVISPRDVVWLSDSPADRPSGTAR